jgi:hypothetical protein
VITVGVIAGVIVALGAIISGIISVGRWIYHRGEEAQRQREEAQRLSEERARIAAYIAAHENRDRDKGDGGSVSKRARD